ncbi:hypothetical protein DL771_000625 [Monosporascus sp. 5C6A]|nr:hypothetical protein DL771_000625 [Monosporascus sp. 5C6A]
MKPSEEAQKGGSSTPLPNSETIEIERNTTETALAQPPRSEIHALEPPSPTTLNPITPSSEGSQQEEDLITKVLLFLSTATPTTLGGVAVGLSAVTYLVLGQIGLLLIGAFAGITLYTSWESRQPNISNAVRGEKGLEFLQRLLETKTASTEGKAEQDEEGEFEALARSFDDFQPETREALSALVDAVIRDYVDWWYGPILPTDKSFPLSCRKVLISFILNISRQLGSKRPADAFVDFLTHTCSIIIVFLAQMATAFSELPSDRESTAADAIYNYLSSDSDSPLSNLLNTRQQAQKFKMVAEDLLGFLDKTARDCDPVKIFLREILSTIVLEGTLQTCSKADWINGWIVYLLESGETDLSQAIDEAIENQKAFSDIDGNVGNIALSKGNRNSYEMDKARRKEQAHKKKLSRADEEMEKAMEEMKRLNEMIAEADRSKDASNRKISSENPGLLDNALLPNGRDLDSNTKQQPNEVSPEKPNDRVSEPKVTPREPSLDKNEVKVETPYSPITPGSTTGLSSQNSSPGGNQGGSAAHHFTSFDQIVPPAREDYEEDEIRRPPPLTLHNAIITIHDDSPNGKGQLRSKPSWEYLIQIEPASSQHPGWMIMKAYPQFEALHESLRRIASVSGAAAFLEAHATFPAWKVHTRSSLRGEIERYMRNACAEKSLAESEAFKRFLEKGQEPRAANKGFSLESVGKGVLGALQSAPKGAFDSGKMVVGGVTGVFGNIGLGSRKSTNSSLQESQIASPQNNSNPRPLSLPALPRLDSFTSTNGTGASMSRDSLDSQRSSVISVQPGKLPPMERRPSYQADSDQASLQPTPSDRWERRSPSGASSRGHSRASSMAAVRSPLRSPSETSLNGIKLPPPPNEVADDYGSPTATRHSTDGNSRLLSPTTTMNSGFHTSPTRTQAPIPLEKPPVQACGPIKRRSRQHIPLSEQETRVAVELLFAVITELYTLSSAWNIRRTLLTAAKSFLLRPGNTSLTSIQSLIQQSVLDANTTDAGIAAYLRKLRENSLPTEDERKAWPAELTSEEREELRIKARKLFIQSSVPTALMGIMGQSATGEALGRVFDCLQIEEVARGLFFGILLQAVRLRLRVPQHAGRGPSARPATPAPRRNHRPTTLGPRVYSPLHPVVRVPDDGHTHVPLPPYSMHIQDLGLELVSLARASERGNPDTDPNRSAPLQPRRADYYFMPLPVDALCDTRSLHGSRCGRMVLEDLGGREGSSMIVRSNTLLSIYTPPLF